MKLKDVIRAFKEGLWQEVLDLTEEETPPTRETQAKVSPLSPCRDAASINDTLSQHGIRVILRFIISHYMTILCLKDGGIITICPLARTRTSSSSPLFRSRIYLPLADRSI